MMRAICCMSRSMGCRMAASTLATSLLSAGSTTSTRAIMLLCLRRMPCLTLVLHRTLTPRRE
eukprot:1329489-Prymnesium_polylepis.1